MRNSKKPWENEDCQAISYGRFSSDKQEEGISQDRQQEIFENFCQEFGLKIFEEVFFDEGLSGYHGVHRTKGNFGKLLKRIFAGELRGKILVVEDFKRFGREQCFQTTDTIRKILEAGVMIGHARNRRVYTVEDLENTEAVMGMTIEIQLARRESADKAYYTKKNRIRILETGLTKNKELPLYCPKWVSVSGSKYVLNALGLLLQKAVKLSIAGYGAMGIKQKLKVEGKIWTGLANTLRSPNLVKFGACDENTFVRLQAALDSRRTSKGRRGKKVTNLFTNLLFDARNQKQLWARATSKGVPMLLNEDGYRGVKGFKCFRYLLAEKALLTFLEDIQVSDIQPLDVSNLEVDRLEGELARLKRNRDKVHQDYLTAEDVTSLRDVLKLLDRQISLISTQLASEKKKSTLGTDRERLADAKSIIGLLSGAKEEELLDIRTRLKDRIRSIVEGVYFNILDSTHAEVQIFLRNGVCKWLIIEEDVVTLSCPPERIKSIAGNWSLKVS